MPRKIVSLFEEYEESHKHPVNIAIHWVAEPVTIWAFMALLCSVPYLQPLLMLFVTALLLLYFATLSWKLAVPMSVVAIVFAASIVWLEQMIPSDFLVIAMSLFVVSWVSLLLGHRIEGNRPSVFSNPHLIFIGPAWLAARVFKRFGFVY